MALSFNGGCWGSTPGVQFLGTTVAMRSLRRWGGNNNWYGQWGGGESNKDGVPAGYGHPYAAVLPPKAGGMRGFADGAAAAVAGAAFPGASADVGGAGAVAAPWIVDLAASVTALGDVSYAGLGVTPAPTVGALVAHVDGSGGVLTETTAEQYVWDLPLEAGITHKEALRVMFAAMAGKLSGAPAGPIAIRDKADTKDRIVATVDGSGNRLTITLDPSD